MLWEVSNQPHIFVVPPEPSFAINPEKMNWSKWEWHDIVDSWNWKGFEGTALEIHVYNRSDSVALFIDEKSLGFHETNRSNEWIAKWRMPYQPGVLKAVNYKDGVAISSNELRTANVPNQIKLIPDRLSIKANGQDLCYITVELLDENGIRNPNIEQLVEFEIEGPGQLIAVASSNPMSTESYKKPNRMTYQGRCLVIVKSEITSGEISLKAKSENLPEATISIETK